MFANLFSFSSRNSKIEKINNIKEELKDEKNSLIYLEKFNFEKQLKKIENKLKNKKIIIYGAGAFFQTIKKHYNISNLDIIGISDRSFLYDNGCADCLGYKKIVPNEIVKHKPDYIIVATKFYMNIIEDLYYNHLPSSKIKIIPLLKKPLFVLLKEMQG